MSSDKYNLGIEAMKALATAKAPMTINTKYKAPTKHQLGAEPETHPSSPSNDPNAPTSSSEN